LVHAEETAAVAEARAWTIHSPDSRTHAPGAAPVPLKRAALRRALAGAGLETRYQPLTDMIEGHPVAVEALVRLTLSRNITLFPGDFLPQVEAAGLGGALTDAVAERAFADWAAWPAGTPRPTLSLNVSLDVMLAPQSLARLEARRIAANLPSDSVLIELTESRPADDLLRLRRSVDRLRHSGYGVALDDITPSLPHLASLIDMPFTDLKLDRAVVQAARHWPDAARFISGIVKRARTRDVAVTAEGVEDEATMAKMRGLGVHYVQGFHCAQPMRAEDLPAWLNSRPQRRSA
jgi:EAL domain-containing protein (putative c-di-GMP-specific phosphodiesterase class I)